MKVFMEDLDSNLHFHISTIEYCGSETTKGNESRIHREIRNVKPGGSASYLRRLPLKGVGTVDTDKHHSCHGICVKVCGVALMVNKGWSILRYGFVSDDSQPSPPNNYNNNDKVIG